MQNIQRVTGKKDPEKHGTIHVCFTLVLEFKRCSIIFYLKYISFYFSQRTSHLDFSWFWVWYSFQAEQTMAWSSWQRSNTEIRQRKLKQPRRIRRSEGAEHRAPSEHKAPSTLHSSSIPLAAPLTKDICSCIASHRTKAQWGPAHNALMPNIAI